jgi:hypothetical protein
MFDKLKIENDLAELRKKWVKQPSMRDIIERQAKCLKIALEKIENNAYEQAKEIFK